MRDATHILLRTGRCASALCPSHDAYNAIYQQTALTDGNGQTTTFGYDSKHRLSLIRYPLATADEGYDTIRFTLYDDSNRLLRRIDGRGQVTDYAYDNPGGSLTAISYPADPGDDLAFGYDDLGRRTSMADAEGSHAYAYDDGGTLLSHTVSYTGLAAKTVSYTYYPNGSRATLTHPGDSLTWHYDEAGRPSSLAYGLGTAAWDYLANGTIARQTLPNGAFTDYAYHGHDTPTSYEGVRPSGSLFDRQALPLAGLEQVGIGPR